MQSESCPQCNDEGTGNTDRVCPQCGLGEVVVDTSEFVVTDDDAVDLDDDTILTSYG